MELDANFSNLSGHADRILLEARIAYEEEHPHCTPADRDAWVLAQLAFRCASLVDHLWKIKRGVDARPFTWM